MYDECIETWTSFSTATESHTTCPDFRYVSLILTLSCVLTLTCYKKWGRGGVLKFLKF